MISNKNKNVIKKIRKFSRLSIVFKEFSVQNELFYTQDIRVNKMRNDDFYFTNKLVKYII